ncbi:mutator type transposase [Tanacetum coccineum]
MLRDYVMELKECNPNTTVRIGVETEEDHTSPTRIFKRIYICLGASKAGFKACKREFLGLDGAFMKGPFPGKLLTAVGIDPNNGIYPLAYGIVETESRESWTWFLEHLKDDLDLPDNSNLHLYVTGKRKWELTRMPCKHAVASIWNMAANRVVVGVPETWVHPCHIRRSCKGPQVPKVNKTVATSRRGASASTVKGSASGSKAATQKGNKSSASVKVAASSSKAPQKGNKTVGSVKGAASGSKAAAQKGKKTVAASGKGSSQATQPSGNSPKKQPKNK